ncbi:MAG: helix-turn-helix transcriptional regulator [Clostridiales bacterium]|nr:helix-turn-helix transcriptional regulator [Clostridiales bacterium]
MLGDKLKEIMRVKGVDCRELSNSSEVPLETIRNLYYGKVTDPKVSTVTAISKALGCSVNHLMGEEIYTPKEVNLILNYRKCGSHGKALMYLVGRYEAMTARHDCDDAYVVPCFVPEGAMVDGFEYKCSEVIDVETDCEDVYAAIKVTSNNFMPSFCKGDIILLEDRFPEDGERAVFVIDGNRILPEIRGEKRAECAPFYQPSR